MIAPRHVELSLCDEAQVNDSATIGVLFRPTLPLQLAPMLRFAHVSRASSNRTRSGALYRRARTGFTLIEILVVIVVIAILATLVAPNIFKNVGEAKSTTARAQIENLSSALDAYRLDNGTYPTTQQGLDALSSIPTIDPPPNWKQPYLRKAVPVDPWGKPYVYIFPGESNPQGFDLISYGADGKIGGEGEDADILSWK